VGSLKIVFLAYPHSVLKTMKTLEIKALVPAQKAWGMLEFTLVDPSGVLWRIAQNVARQ